MGDVKTIGSHGPTRRFLSALKTGSLKTNIFAGRQTARRALLDISDAHAMLTSVEDSLETIVDVLTEMKLLATQAIQDGTTFEKNHRGRSGAKDDRIAGRSDGDVASRPAAYKVRLNELSQEIDQIVRDTDYFGRPLFDDKQTSYTFLVDISEHDTLQISFDPLSAAQLSVAEDDIRISDNGEAVATLERIEEATARVHERLDRLVDVSDRLTFKYENVETSRSTHDASVHNVEDAASAREQMELTKLRIVEESGQASLAQANATPDSTMRLVEATYRDDADGPFARIYSLDHDRTGGPATHLRSIMLGQSPKQPA